MVSRATGVLLLSRRMRVPSYYAFALFPNVFQYLPCTANCVGSGRDGQTGAGRDPRGKTNRIVK